mmetsp:Transcript_32582/g.49822  ORF Transcript_32582/g.49822 Transcript_32582/m.49822 type:complete len:169 (+) Transcript_32582:808-1314(+)
MTLITIYALLGDDLKLLLFPKGTDDTFTLLTSASLIFFMVEIILASLAKPGYFNSFFFWLDLISTLSLITDIEPAMDAIFGASDETDASDAVALARASRGARIGTRAGRMTRVIRLIRLIRIVKLYKSANQALVHEQENRLGHTAPSRLDDINAQAIQGSEEKENIDI